MSDALTREAERLAAQGDLDAKRMLMRQRLREAGTEAERVIAYLTITREEIQDDPLLNVLVSNARTTGNTAEEIMAHAVRALINERAALLDELLQARREALPRIYAGWRGLTVVSEPRFAAIMPHGTP